MGGSNTGIPTNLPARVRDLSLKGMKLEPASGAAIRNLGFYYSSHGNSKRAKALMDAAYRTSRRDPGVNLWQTEYYSRRGNTDAALRFYDMTIRTNSAASAQLMTMMARVLDQPQAPRAFVALLSKSPPWLDDFWTEILSGEGDLENAFFLRRELHERGIEMEPSHDALLIEKLANTGRLAEAFDLYAYLGKPTATELVADSDFDQKVTYPPIGWKVVAESNFGSSIDTKNGTLNITAIPGAEGVAAQQLIAVRGRRSLVLSMRYEGAGKMPLTLDVTCADSGSSGAAAGAVPVTSGSKVPVQLGQDCQFAWLSIVLPKDNDQAGRSIVVHSVSVKPHGS
ncbi:tetratricopeptide repeat protein [Tsuneonella sp. HG249]